MPRKRAEINLEEALQLYGDKTVPFNDKAKQLGVSPDTLRKFLRENGVDIPGKKGKAGSKLSIDKVTELYVVQNKSRKEAAKELGVSLSTLARFITDNKIEKDPSKIVELREKTMMERYGVAHALDSDEFKDKARETCRANHGVDYPMQSTEVMEKSRATSRENWGTDSPRQSERYKEMYGSGSAKPAAPRYSELPDEEKARIQAERSERRKQTMSERYGAENPSQVPEIREKARATTRERYGDGEFFRTETFHEKAVSTNRERYGTDHPMQSDEVKEKARNTSRERYGTDYPIQSPEIQAKVKEGHVGKYGVDNPMKTAAVKQRLRGTMMERYGVENPSQVPEFQEKKRKTIRKRYGADNYSQQAIGHLDEWTDAGLFAAACRALAANLGRKPHADDLMAYFNAGPTAVYARIERFGCRDLVNMSTSYIEDKWRQWLVSEGVECSDHPERNLVKDDGSRPLEIDIFIPAHNLGIEIDPTSTHNSTVPYYNSAQPKTQTYHQKKSMLADRLGINLVHVYDFADEDKMKSIIRSLCQMNDRVHARNTVCEPVSAKEERKFLEANHLQGYVKSEKAYGLFSKDGDHELLALMTFGRPRYGSGDEKDIRWELLRFCSLDGVTVVGGASKLFSAFVRDCDPDSVLSYANYDISNGKMYEKLGFEYRRTTGPSYTWVNLEDPSDTYSWYVVNSKGFDNLFGTNYGKGTSNKELMEQAGYVQVYNSGNKVYVWTKPE